MRYFTHSLCAIALLVLQSCGDGHDVPSGVSVTATVQSACKKESAGDGPTNGQLLLSSEGNGVAVRHVGGSFNCASKLELKVTLRGSTLRVDEVVQNPGEVARCMCSFDLSTSVQGLAPGSYQVELYDYNHNLVGTASTVIK